MSAGDAAASGVPFGASGVAAADRTGRTAAGAATGARATGEATAETGSGAGSACGVSPEGEANEAFSPGAVVAPRDGPLIGLSEVCSEILGTAASAPASADTATPARAGEASSNRSNAACMT